MRVRKTTKRLHTEDWRPWQHEEYIGCHEFRDWTPADDADPRGYKFRPCFFIPSPPVIQENYVTPQTGIYMSQKKEVTVWQRLKKWLLSGGSGT